MGVGELVFFVARFILCRGADILRAALCLVGVVTLICWGTCQTGELVCITLLFLAYLFSSCCLCWGFNGCAVCC